MNLFYACAASEMVYANNYEKQLEYYERLAKHCDQEKEREQYISFYCKRARQKIRTLKEKIFMEAQKK
jgi:hypothetical protein